MYNGITNFISSDFCRKCRDNKWKFLDGVKVSGAPPPRSVIVQQCIRDVEVLEALCDYVSISIMI